MSVDGDILASAPSIIRCNFSETEPLGLTKTVLKTARETIRDSQVSSRKKKRSSSAPHKFIESRDSTGEPRTLVSMMVELVAKDIKVLFNVYEECNEVTMATVSLKGSSIEVGRKGCGFVIAGCIKDVCGYEGTGNDSDKKYGDSSPFLTLDPLSLSLSLSLSRIITRSVIHAADGRHSNQSSPILQIEMEKQKNELGGRFIVLRNMNNNYYYQRSLATVNIMSTCVCLWPSVFKSFMTLLSQYKTRGRHKKRRNAIIATRGERTRTTSYHV